MAAFNSIEEMVPVTTLAGWRFDRPPGIKITPDCDTIPQVTAAIQAYARREGLSANGVFFYVVEETTTYTPLSRTRFVITTTTEPIV